MRFEELNDSNFLLFAVKNYENPQAITKRDFDKDLNHFKYVKRLLRKYRVDGELKYHLVINHMIILYNIFGDAATPMLFFKLENDLWSVLKSFVVCLNRLPEYPRCYIHELEMDMFCYNQLEEILNGKQED